MRKTFLAILLMACVIIGACSCAAGQVAGNVGRESPSQDSETTVAEKDETGIGAALAGESIRDAVYVASSVKAYDSDGSLAREHRYELDEQGNLLKQTSESYSSSGVSTTEYSYEHDDNGNITTRLYVKDGEELSFEIYKNELNDLGLVARSTTVQSEDNIHEYDYSNKGILEHHSELLHGEKMIEQTFDDAGFELTRFEASGSFDANGNVQDLEYQTTSYAWTKDWLGFPTHLTASKEATSESGESIVEWEIETDSFGNITRRRNLDTGEYAEYAYVKVTNPSPYAYAYSRLYHA